MASRRKSPTSVLQMETQTLLKGLADFTARDFDYGAACDAVDTLLIRSTEKDLGFVVATVISTAAAVLEHTSDYRLHFKLFELIYELAVVRKTNVKVADLRLSVWCSKTFGAIINLPAFASERRLEIDSSVRQFNAAKLQFMAGTRFPAGFTSSVQNVTCVAILEPRPQTVMVQLYFGHSLFVAAAQRFSFACTYEEVSSVEIDNEVTRRTSANLSEVEAGDVSTTFLVRPEALVTWEGTTISSEMTFTFRGPCDNIPKVLRSKVRTDGVRRIVLPSLQEGGTAVSQKKRGRESDPVDDHRRQPGSRGCESSADDVLGDGCEVDVEESDHAATGTRCTHGAAAFVPNKNFANVLRGVLSVECRALAHYDLVVANLVDACVEGVAINQQAWENIVEENFPRSAIKKGYDPAALTSDSVFASLCQSLAPGPKPFAVAMNHKALQLDASLKLSFELVFCDSLSPSESARLTHTAGPNVYVTQMGQQVQRWMAEQLSDEGGLAPVAFANGASGCGKTYIAWTCAPDGSHVPVLYFTASDIGAVCSRSEGPDIDAIDRRFFRGKAAWGENIEPKNRDTRNSNALYVVRQLLIHFIGINKSNLQRSEKIIIAFDEVGALNGFCRAIVDVRHLVRQIVKQECNVDHVALLMCGTGVEASAVGSRADGVNTVNVSSGLVSEANRGPIVLGKMILESVKEHWTSDKHLVLKSVLDEQSYGATIANNILQNARALFYFLRLFDSKFSIEPCEAARVETWLPVACHNVATMYRQLNALNNLCSTSMMRVIMEAFVLCSNNTPFEEFSEDQQRLLWKYGVVEQQYRPARNGRQYTLRMPAPIAVMAMSLFGLQCDLKTGELFQEFTLWYLRMAVGALTIPDINTTATTSEVMAVVLEVLHGTKVSKMDPFNLRFPHDGASEGQAVGFPAQQAVEGRQLVKMSGLDVIPEEPLTMIDVPIVLQSQGWVCPNLGDAPPFDATFDAVDSIRCYNHLVASRLQVGGWPQHQRVFHALNAMTDVNDGQVKSKLQALVQSITGSTSPATVPASRVSRKTKSEAPLTENDLP